MTKKKTPAKLKSLVNPATQSSLFHRLDALLHTMRCIAQYEDSLCELSHEIKRSDFLTPETGDALRVILDKIPSRDYVHDLDSVNELLEEATNVKKSPSKTTMKSSPPGSGKKSPKKSLKPTGKGSAHRAG